MAKPAEGHNEGTVPHHKLHETAHVVGAGTTGSKVFNIDEIPDMSSHHDGRRKRVLLNTLNTGSAMLVDILAYAPGGTSPLHRHRGTEHFFYVLEGRGSIVISDVPHPLRAGSVVWIAEGEVHKVFADKDSPLVFLEYFSAGQHETDFIETACAWQPGSKG